MALPPPEPCHQLNGFRSPHPSMTGLLALLLIAAWITGALLQPQAAD
jgi:hypothetical protein